MHLLDLISHLCCEFEVASLRADIVIHKAARALAALAGRSQVTPDDVRGAAELALPHRRRRKPFEQPGLDKERLDELMQQALQPPDENESDAEDTDQENEEQNGEITRPTTGICCRCCRQCTTNSSGYKSKHARLPVNATRQKMRRVAAWYVPCRIKIQAVLRLVRHYAVRHCAMPTTLR